MYARVLASRPTPCPPCAVVSHSAPRGPSPRLWPGGRLPLRAAETSPPGASTDVQRRSTGPIFVLDGRGTFVYGAVQKADGTFVPLTTLETSAFDLLMGTSPVTASRAESSQPRQSPGLSRGREEGRAIGEAVRPWGPDARRPRRGRKEILFNTGTSLLAYRAGPGDVFSGAAPRSLGAVDGAVPRRGRLRRTSRRPARASRTGTSRRPPSCGETGREDSSREPASGSRRSRAPPFPTSTGTGNRTSSTPPS